MNNLNSSTPGSRNCALQFVGHGDQDVLRFTMRAVPIIVTARLDGCPSVWDAARGHAATDLDGADVVDRAVQAALDR